MQSKCKAMQSKFTRLVFVLILSNCLIINKTVVSFRYAVFIQSDDCSMLDLFLFFAFLIAQMFLFVHVL